MKHRLIILLFALTVNNCSYGGASVFPSVQQNVDASATSQLSEIKKDSETDIPQLNYWISPDGQWKVIAERLNSEYEAGFYAVKIHNESSKNGRTLFTIWDAEVGSGARLRLRWTSDSKAVRLKGDTRGFDYNHPNQKYQSFDYIYLIDSAQLYSTP